MNYDEWEILPSGMHYRQWQQRRVDDLIAWIDKLRHYQSDPMTEMPRSRWSMGHVYLMWCLPPVAAYKIGHSKDSWDRRYGLKQRLRCKVEFVKAYTPVLSRELMEAALHNHFNHRRREGRGRQRNCLSTELFTLSQEEADDFETTAKAVEWHLLPVEIFRLESRLRQLEAELHNAE